MSDVEHAEPASTGSGLRLTRTADTVNTGLMAVLVLLYAGHRVFPAHVPGLDTAFPVVATVAFAVSMSAWGVESGLLPTAGSQGGGGR